MALSGASRGRVVLAVDTASLTAPALDAAAALATSLRRELAALFVEDERLLRLPVPHSADASGAPPEMAQAFRAQAAHFRRMVEASARSLALAWTFDVAQGDMLSAAFARLGADDLLVIAKGRLADFRLGEQPDTAARFHALAARPILALIDDSATALRALEAACAIARVIASDVVLVMTAPAAQASAMREQASAWLAERGTAARYLVPDTNDVAGVALAAKLQNAGALIVAEPADERERPALAALIEQIGCPAVVLPTARPGSRSNAAE